MPIQYLKKQLKDRQDSSPQGPVLDTTALYTHFH